MSLDERDPPSEITIGGTPGSPTLRAYVQLESMIRRGEIGGGERLPSERRLSELLGVSRGTIRQALAALEERRIVEAVPNSGWFAVEDKMYVDENELRSFTEMAHQRGLSPSSTVISIEQRPASYDEANRLRIAPSTPIIQIDRVRYFDDRPVCVHVAVIPTSVATLDRLSDLEAGSLHRTMELVGRVPSRAAYSMRADGCVSEIASMLNLEVGAPVLIAEEVVYDQNDQPIQLNLLTYRADAYRFQASLYRRQSRRTAP